jgi:predicted permease
LHRIAMRLLTDLTYDFRHSVRSLLRSPGFTVVTVAVLALGIGATSAIFSLASAVWIKPLPFADAERLVTLWVDLTSVGGPPRVEVAPGNYADWWPRAQSFESMTPIEPASFNLTGGSGEPERLAGVRTTANLFETIGLQPLLGRTFLPGDADDKAVVVGQGFWLRRLGGDASAVGRSITLDGSPYTIVGVVPRDFRFPNGEIDVFVPTVFASDVLARRTSYYWYLIAKLRAGVSTEVAQAEMSTIATALESESPKTGRGVRVSLVPLREQLARGVSLFARDVTSTLGVLLGAVGLVLLIACANVANLVLTRVTLRQKELAIRKALGAAPGRVLRQLLTESWVLASVSVVIGIAIAAACSGYLSRLIPNTLPGTASAMDVRVRSSTIAVAFVTVVLFGVGPAYFASRRELGTAFGRTVGAGSAKARRLRMALVVGEIALTVVLLAGAGLLLRSYRAVLAVDPGFDAGGLLIAETVLSPSRYAEKVRREEFQQRVLERVRALPGVTSAGYTNYAPLTFMGGRSVLFTEQRPRPLPGELPVAPEELMRHVAVNRAVSSGYLETLRVPLIRGRLLDERDSPDASFAVVVNQTLARNEWPDRDPIGQRLMMGAGDDAWMTVVGVVGDARQMGLDQPPNAEIFVPFHEITSPFMWPRQLVIRTRGEPLALTAAVRRAVWDVDPAQPVNVRAMADVLDAELGNRNTQLTLTSAFAMLALVLAAVGLYGVLSYTVSQSTAEIGLRMALGADVKTVVGSLVRSAVGTALSGITIGMMAAVVLMRAIRSFLYGVSTWDPLTAGVVASVLLVVATLAALVPAWRAARVDPATTLRTDA